jgi:NADPH:quinone reductase-like Zn-dependent oxidoreductase
LKVGDEIYAVAAALWPVANPKTSTLHKRQRFPWLVLVTHGKLQIGQKVCILGGSGGVVGHPNRKTLGASEVIAAGSSVGMIKGFGADTVINYSEQSIADELKGKELDLVFDTIAGYEAWRIFLTIVGMVMDF